jgi:cGMP-dependent protein kinase 1
MKISSYKAQESIFRRGIVGFQKLVVVIEGSLKKLKSSNVVATKGQCYGEEFLKDPNKILDDEVIMQNYGVVAEISEEAFREAVGQKDFASLIARKREEHDSMMVRLEVPNETRAALARADIRQLQVLTALKT